MAGAGLDALMIRDADGALKKRLGTRRLRLHRREEHLRYDASGPTRVRIDGDKWFDGDASCVLVGNVGKVLGKVSAFPDARPDDGLLDIGIVTAKGLWQWTRTLARTATGDASSSPFVRNRTRRDPSTFASPTPLPYELDGGDRKKTRRLRIKVHHEALTVCVPAVTD